MKSRSDRERGRGHLTLSDQSGGNLMGKSNPITDPPVPLQQKKAKLDMQGRGKREGVLADSLDKVSAILYHPSNLRNFGTNRLWGSECPQGVRVWRGGFQKVMHMALGSIKLSLNPC